MDGELWRSAYDLAAEMSAGVDFMGKDGFDRLEVEASQSLNRERHRTEGEWLAAINRWYAMRASTPALHEFAARELDRGRTTHAAAALRLLVDHARTDPALRERSAAREIVALHLAGNHREARNRRISQADLLIRSKLTGPMGEPLLDWVDRALQAGPTVSTSVWPAPSPRDIDAQFPQPALDPAWRFDVSVPAEVAALLRESSDELHGQGIHRVPSGLPIVVGQTVICRLLDEIVALDLASGNVRWRKAAGTIWNQVTGNLKLLQNDGFADMITRRLVYRNQADSLYTRLASDGQRVFATIEPEAPVAAAPLPKSLPATADPVASAAANYNRLVAWDVESGEELWRRGAPAAPAAQRAAAGDSDAWDRGVTFLGVPAVHDFSLYVMGRCDSHLELFAVHAADGELLWRLPLVETQDEAPLGESRPLAPASPVLLHRGVLLCPTASGALVAVDLVRRVGLWCRRYSRDDVGRSGTSTQNQWSRQLLYPWWDGWREVALAAHDGRVLLTGPDLNALTLLDVRTGQRFWSRPREDGLFVASLGDEGAIVVGRDAVRCYELATGSLQWTATTGAVAGRPGIDGSSLLVPLADGGVAVVTRADGQVRVIPAERPDVLGNLVRYPGGAVALTNERLVRLAPLEERLETALRLATAKPDDVSAQRSIARLRLESGDFRGAMKIASALRLKQDDAAARALHHDLLLAQLEIDPTAGVDNWPALESLLETPESRVHALDALARGASRVGSLVEALRAWIRLQELNPSGDWNAQSRNSSGSADAPADSIRYDRHIQGEIANLLSTATVDDRVALHELVDEAFDHAVRSADPFALQRFARQYDSLPWGRRVRLRQSARVGIGVGFTQSEIALLDLAQLADRPTAAAALHESMKFLVDRGWRADAAMAARRLRDDFGDVPLADGESARTAVSSLPPESLLARQIREGLPEPWPPSAPKITVTAERNRDTDYLPLPLQAAPDSLFNRISVSVERAGRRLRFHGGGQLNAWDLTLPDSKSMFRNANPLHRGWAWGHLLVVRIGSELFGVAPFNDQGDPKASLVWRVDMYGARMTKWNQLGVRVRPSPPGFGLDDVVLVDRFGRDRGQVGPVQPGYLCYRDQARLVAVETATGARLWERHDVPTKAVVAGNSEYVVLARPGEGSVEILRAFDGQSLEKFSSPVPLESIMSWHGSRALASDGTRLAFTDVVSRRPLWERPLVAGTLPFAVDEERCGLAEPDGTLHIIQLSDGQTLNTVRVEGPARLERVYSTIDERNVYVALSGPFQNPDNQRLQTDQGGFRSPAVSGRLAAIARETGRVLWNVVLDDASLPFEQPREIPFLIVQHWRVGNGNKAMENPVAVQRLIDKRTGEERHRSQRATPFGWYTLEPNADQRRVELRDTQQTLRWQFE
ncbi:MAG: PQQ-binding-like beta-propeller repeat protein [Planctomycetaceae bacterium]|nr:PQQ-binding-like beta-propeller repeat protein [Planctomycetaceae bacterium]